ncbi:MAG: hypothetical protein ACQESF_06340 [Nanobdellota archaeon]
MPNVYLRTESEYKPKQVTASGVYNAHYQKDEYLDELGMKGSMSYRQGLEEGLKKNKNLDQKELDRMLKYYNL